MDLACALSAWKRPVVGRAHRRLQFSSACAPRRDRRWLRGPRLERRTATRVHGGCLAVRLWRNRSVTSTLP